MEAGAKAMAEEAIKAQIAAVKEVMVKDSLKRER